jgi:predicted nucleotide-binding protein (sugar kinase/HSP70/actin superfamily)
MLRFLLDEAGLQALDILSANADNGYQGMGDDPLRFRLLAWQGIVAVDLLLKLRHDHRPYERVKGETDRLYAACLDRLVAAIQAGGGRRTTAVLRRAAAQFAGIELDRSHPRPVIGIVGEIYLRNNTFTSQDIARQVEELGGQVWVAPMMEWIYFSVWGTRERARLAGRWLAWLKALSIEWAQQVVERRLLKPVQHMLCFPHEPAMAALMDGARPYYHPMLGTEAVLSIGKAVDYARHGLCGVLNVLPFTCMPSLVVTGLAQSIRADHDHIPWLDVIYDAQGGTNVSTRLEAFMYQAGQYMAAR